MSLVCTDSHNPSDLVGADNQGENAFLKGSLTSAGVYTFTLKATDANGKYVTKQISTTVVGGWYI